MLTQEEVDSVIDTINDRAIEIRSLIVTIGSIVALLMPAVEIVGLIDFTPYGEGDNEWIIDDDWEMGEDFTCGDGSVIEYSLFDDGYKNCRDGSDEPDEPIITHPSNNNTTVIIEPIYGCMDDEALNFDDEATDEDDSCEYPVYGCTDPDAENYNETSDTEDGSCEYEEEVIKGCTDPDAENYDETADTEDGSCEYYEPIEGCTDPTALNYNGTAESDDGSCEYEEPVEEDCVPEMYDAWWQYNSTNDTIRFEWDADLSCSDKSHNLTVFWTIYENETGNQTGNWTGLQAVLTYETYYQDWDYVNMTLTNLTDGRYDIFATFSIKQNGEERYSRAGDWYDVCMGEC